MERVGEVFKITTGHFQLVPVLLRCIIITDIVYMNAGEEE